MPGQRQFGMDHHHYDWAPMVNRGLLRWPRNARLALCVIISLERMDWTPPPGSFTPDIAGVVGAGLFPDYDRLSRRDYGHRVGIFRILEVLDRFGIRPTVAMDALTAENYPYLVDHCLKGGCEIIAHGVSVSRMITSNMSEGEEQEYIRASVDAVTRATGSKPAGWLGPEYGESPRTPELLAQAGIRYVCDWTNDEQPYALRTDQGELYSLPVMLEFDDVTAMLSRRLPVNKYADLLREGFDTMYHDGAQTGRVIVLNLHPWLIGQPFSIGYLEEALGHMVGRQGVWPATGSEIVDWYRGHAPSGGASSA